MDHKIYLAQNSLVSINLHLMGIHEEKETNLVKSQIKEGEIIVDIGANIGYYTLLFAKLVGASGNVFAFEPEPYNFQLLQKNVKANSYQNVTIEKKAILDKNGKTNLYLSKSNVGSHSIFPRTKNHQTCIEVETITLDDYFNNKTGKKISFVKIDAECSEPAVLRGMTSILTNKNLKHLIEYAPSNCRRFDEKFSNFLKFLTEYGFGFHSILFGKNLIEPISERQLLKKRFNNSINLFCTKLSSYE